MSREPAVPQPPREEHRPHLTGVEQQRARPPAGHARPRTPRTQPFDDQHAERRDENNERHHCRRYWTSTRGLSTPPRAGTPPAPDRRERSDRRGPSDRRERLRLALAGHVDEPDVAFLIARIRGIGVRGREIV